MDGSGEVGFSKWLANKGLNWALISLAIFTLLPLFIISFYNHPTYQDYFESWFVFKYGFWEAQKYFYINWQGRYVESFLEASNPLVFHAFWAFKLNPILLLSALVLACYWLVGNIFRDLKSTGKMAITSVFIFAFIRLMPQLFSGVYWQAGGYFNNLTPSVLTFLLLGCVINYYHSQQKRIYFIASCLLVAIIIGCYDIHMLYTNTIIFVLLFFAVIRKEKFVLPATLLVVCIVCSVISFTAPGNAVRSLDYPNAHKFIFSIQQSVKWGADILIHWQWIGFMLIIGFILFDVLGSFEIWNDDTSSLFCIPPYLSIAGCIVMPFTALFCFFYAEGRIIPQMNTMNGVYFYFLISMMYCWLSVIWRIKKRYPDFRLKWYFKLSIYMVLVYLTFFRTNNITSAYNDIFNGSASAYNTECNNMENILTNSKSDSCYVDSIRSKPVTLPNFDYVGGMSGEGNDHFTYLECRDYYKKEFIGIKKAK